MRSDDIKFVDSGSVYAPVSISEIRLYQTKSPPLILRCPSDATVPELFAVMKMLFIMSSSQGSGFNYDVKGYIKQHQLGRFFVEDCS